MSKSLIQVVNTTSQTLVANSTIGLGTATRRYGCNCRLNGDAIEVNGEGYFTVDATVTVEPTAAGTVSVALYSDGALIPGSLSTGSVSTAGNPITLPIVATIRRGCCCASANNLTLVLITGAGAVTGVSFRVEKS